MAAYVWYDMLYHMYTGGGVIRQSRDFGEPTRRNGELTTITTTSIRVILHCYVRLGRPPIAVLGCWRAGQKKRYPTYVLPYNRIKGLSLKSKREREEARSKKRA